MIFACGDENLDAAARCLLVQSLNRFPLLDNINWFLPTEKPNEKILCKFITPGRFLDVNTHYGGLLDVSKRADEETPKLFHIAIYYQ